MKRYAALALAVLLCACQTVGGTQAPSTNATAPGFDAERHRNVGWFRAASHLRHCFGRQSPDGAFWAAMAAGIGGFAYLRHVPKASRQRSTKQAIGLMLSGYKGQRAGYQTRLSCKQLARAVFAVYRRQSPKVRNAIAHVMGSLLKSDRPGRILVARMRRQPSVGRRRLNRRAPRIRRAILKPSEQQVPLGE